MKYKIVIVELSTCTMFFPKVTKWYWFKWYFITDFSGFGNLCFYNIKDVLKFIKSLEK